MKENDAFTGQQAQSDAEFLAGGGDFTAQGIKDAFDDGLDDGLESLEQMEKDIDEAELQEGEDDVPQSYNYEHYVIVRKKGLVKFLRMVEPWTRNAIDLYGRSVRVRSVSEDEVEFSFVNNLVCLSVRFPNKSGKTIPEYFMQFIVLRRLLLETYSSLVLVHENDELNFAILDKLLFVETVSLNTKEYIDVKLPDDATDVDLQLMSVLSGKMSFVLSATDRVSEKSVSFKDDKAYLSTTVFAGVLNSPFKFGGFSISKMCLEMLGVLTEVCKVGMRCALVKVKSKDGEDLPQSLIVDVDGLWSVELPVFRMDPVVVEQAEEVINFETSVEMATDTLLKLVDVVNSFEYLSDFLQIQIRDRLEVTLFSRNISRSEKYDFVYSGVPTVRDEIIRVSAAVVKPYLHLSGASAKYAFTRHGWGIANEWGRLLIRKTV